MKWTGNGNEGRGRVHYDDLARRAAMRLFSEPKRLPVRTRKKYVNE